jgi:hypothetical protein
MGKIVELETRNSQIMIESTDVSYDKTVVQAGGLQLEKNLDKMIEKLSPLCESLVSTFATLINKPESGSAEFGQFCCRQDSTNIDFFEKNNLTSLMNTGPTF